VDLLSAILIGYAVGSLPIGYLVAQRARGVDLRRVGSGNVGAANVHRTSGLPMAIMVMLADAAKGAGAVLLGGSGVDGVTAGVAAVCGHVYPVWLGFRGGKGVATASGVFSVLSPLPTAIAAAAFAIVVARTRLVSLGSLVAAVLLPVVEWLTPGLRAVDIGATIVAALILFRHRGNMARLWTRTERVLPPSREALPPSRFALRRTGRRTGGT
jgi:glycerol-3-phosphate acyltransferase PlsY